MTKIVCFIFLSIVLFGYNFVNDDDFVSIKGVILSKKDSTVIPFTHLYIKSSNYGVVSNEKGVFNLFVSKKKYSDTLVISAIGYDNQKYLIADIINSNNIFLLSEKVYEINEIKVMPINCLEIIKKALTKLEDNYPKNPTSLQAYTRQIVVENKQYSRYLEAGLTIYNPSYLLNQKNLENENQIRLNSIKASLNKANSNLKFNVSTADLVDKIFVLKTFEFFKNLKLEDLKFEKYVNFNDKDLYLIAVSPSEQSPYYGKLYIDKESFAIVSMQIKQDLNVEQKAKAYVKKFVNITYKFKTHSVRLDFLPMDDIWNLSYLQDNYEIDIYSEDKVTFNLNLEFINDILISEVNNSDVKQINRTDRINRKKDLYSQAKSYDDKSWENINKIQPVISFSE